ncbi:hypothetical protein HY488_02305 [Candidatus Woesearchaeota archaeon]|nr:hypothetical protein [Candidatus Woesearchaeota archaeon]
MSHTRTITIIIMAFLFLSAILTSGVRNQAHVKLLAVTESGNKTYGGSIANLYIDVKEGTGRVFIDTLPASKLDTQMSTRLARSIACKYVDVDCSALDFFYTIRANSAIVGGPSAGAAVAVVTVAVLKNLELREDVAITGTISSGNLIGPVGGLKDKIDAAATNGITTVLIPIGERSQKLEENETIDLVEYGKIMNLTIIEVGTLDKVMQQFTGRSFEKPEKDIVINPWYRDTMEMLADQLCNRSNVLQATMNKNMLKNNKNISEQVLADVTVAQNLTKQGGEASDRGDHYSSASYCFGANVVYGRVLLQLEDPTIREFRQKINQTKASILTLNKAIAEKEIVTITDLEAYMVVKDRLIEANEHLGLGEENLKKHDEDAAIMELAYANERLHSALSWNEFFGKEGKHFRINKDDLAESCTSKLSEAQEFYQYIDLIFPQILTEAQEQLEKAAIDKERGNYELCLYKATIAKAQMSMIASLLGLPEEKVDELLTRKLAAAKRTIVEQQEKDMFPILGYSYYEYANSLRPHNKYSALLYAEYALELSNLDVYFKTKKAFRFNVPREWWVIFIGGIIVGFMINDIVRMVAKRKEEKMSRISKTLEIKKRVQARKNSLRRKRKRR